MQTRFFCTAGRGMERFVSEEVTQKLSATEVEVMSGKVFFSAEPDLCRLKQLKSAERLFLLLKKGSPLSLPKNKGIARLKVNEYINEQPQLWLQCFAIWEKLQEKALSAAHGDHENVAKRKSQSTSYLKTSKRSKQDAAFESPVQKHKNCSEDQKVMGNDGLNVTEKQFVSQSSSDPVTFRVSCRCSGSNAKVFTAQELGYLIASSLTKQFDWKPNVRMPILEVFVHLNDLYSVVGFPVLRHPLANRSYTRNTGLRSTTAWAMGSLAEISTGALVLDPMCGVGTILVEAAKEWPHGQFFGIDIINSQLESAVVNVKKAGLQEVIEFLKGSVLDLPIVSGSIDAVISDIPFGRKFMSTKNMKELLPAILREMERVLRVGGVIVLLLSQSLYHHLKVNFYFNGADSRRFSIADKDSLNTDKGGSKEDIANKTIWFDMLVPLESHSVSLGVTEAVIFKCKKTISSLTL
ncbi:hypothetical protein GDO86_009395 [Hymenochirus boettgeri]|uniref:Ribosomal RNA large subunit methyltransferase K/L-like methyltransferase domain-containing protein n=1 Tax=Hymenochirus boettgeri TaxID=247094 RepID=A0A8T2JIT0_9PIPI|nr:hypothetical protein GDO86_009395 [Hymenochirus boettgeri]